MIKYIIYKMVFQKESFTYENYVIEVLKDIKTHHIELHIENTKNGTFYQKNIDEECIIKTVKNKCSNIFDLKALYTFFIKCISQCENYHMSMYQTPLSLYTTENVKNRNELILKFSGTFDGYYTIYANYQIEEKILTMEEKLIKMMNKMNTQYDEMKNHYEEKIESLEKELQKLQNIFIQEKYHSPNQTHKVKSSEKEEKKPHVIQNIQIKKEKKCEEDDCKNDNSKNDDCKNDKYYFYQKYVNNTEKSKSILSPYSKKQFFHYYDKIIQKNDYDFYQEFMNNCNEEIIYHCEDNYIKVYITNEGKLFLFGMGVANCLVFTKYIKNDYQTFENIDVIIQDFILKNKGVNIINQNVDALIHEISKKYALK